MQVFNLIPQFPNRANIYLKILQRMIVRALTRASNLRMTPMKLQEVDLGPVLPSVLLLICLETPELTGSDPSVAFSNVCRIRVASSLITSYTR